jgi:hypothetical protein
MSPTLSLRSSTLSPSEERLRSSEPILPDKLRTSLLRLSTTLSREPKTDNTLERSVTALTGVKSAVAKIVYSI